MLCLASAPAKHKLHHCCCCPLQNALSALETYRRQVHGNEQQMQHQIHELQQQLKETTTSLTLLQQQHSACAAAK